MRSRGKRLIALCLVILQVCFQFPIQWKVEGQTRKNKELSFVVIDENRKAVQAANVQVELSVYKKDDIEGDNNDTLDSEETGNEETSSSNIEDSSTSTLK